MAWVTWPGFLVPWSLIIFLRFCPGLGYLDRVLGSMVLGHVLKRFALAWATWTGFLVPWSLVIFLRSILDLRFEFLVNNCVYSRLELSGNPQFGQKITKIIFVFFL